MYNVENRGDGCTMLRHRGDGSINVETSRGWMYNVENRGDVDVQC